MAEIVTFTKEIVGKYIDTIISDTADFEFNNWEEDNFFLDLPDKWKLSIALLNHGSINGFSINSRKLDLFYIHFLYILKKHRKSKAGETLLRECERRAVENNLQTIQLKCSKNNTSALKFYFKYGYINAANSPSDIKQCLLEKKLNK